MIIFSGAGIVIGLVIAVSFGLGQVLLGGFEDDAPKYLTTWAASLGLALAAVINYLLHRLSLLQKGKVFIDKESGQEVVMRPSHSLFFVPLRFWPWICGALSIWWLTLGFIQKSN